MTDKSGPWIPLESNPEVFNKWAQKAGLVTSQAEFVDVYGLDPDLLDMVPQPVKAVVLLFPIETEGEAKRKEEDERIAKEGQPKIDPTIFWVKQTISNACGTIGLIHALANSEVTFAPTSALQKFIIDSKEKSPLERAQLLETTKLFTTIHAESASGGQSQQIQDTDLHFTCFVAAPELDVRKKAQELSLGKEGVKELKEEMKEATGEDDMKGSGMRLVELDGRRAGPIDRGECTDLLKDTANFIKTRYMSGTASVQFNIMALVGKV